jgi:hypothetical protein
MLAHFQAAQLPQVANIPIAAAAITAVASHPSSAMIGTAATPLIMALQISPFTGSRG